MVNYICDKCEKSFHKKSNDAGHKKCNTACKKGLSKVKSYGGSEESDGNESKNESKNEKKYSELSYNLTKCLDKVEKKNNGIYFTPPSTIEKNIERLKKYKNLNEITSVLEPACGSLEYVTALMKEKSDMKIKAVELNKVIYDSIKKYKSERLNIENSDYLKSDEIEKYDLIIGNPPFYVMKKEEIDVKYYDYFDGRPNIFILFIIKSLELLNENGILSFVLPRSFLNCLYYDKTRRYISKNYNIIDIIECDDEYIDTKQETIIMLVEKSKGENENNKYVLNKGNNTIFGSEENINKLNELYKSSSTLKEMGFKVNVGNIVWNQCKSELTSDDSKTLLIYSSDIKNNKLCVQSYKNEEKKNYINREGAIGPLLVINRGYGVGNYKFEYCLLEGKKEYLVENHLICIKKIDGDVGISNESVEGEYKKMIESFRDKRTEEFIKLYFGNNAINTTELCELLPIYDI